MARTWLLPLTGVALASALAACSSGGKSSPATGPNADNSKLDTANLVTQVFAAVGAAQSFHVVGNGKDQGTAYSLDVHFGAGGGAGFFAEGGERFDLVGHGGATYVKTDAAAWQATIGNKPGAAAKAKALAGHWVKVPTAHGDFAQLLDYVDKTHFVKSFSASAASDSGPFQRSGTATVNGTDAVVFTDTKDSSKIYIAAHGAPLLLKVDSSPKDGGGGLTITDYDKPFTPQQPTTTDVVDYSAIVK